jgi:rare lipoprotein A (peptidoglycan hydrolase)
VWRRPLESAGRPRPTAAAAPLAAPEAPDLPHAGTLCFVSFSPTARRVLVAAASFVVAAALACPAAAAPSASDVSADKGRVDAAVAKLKAARDRADAASTRVKKASGELDRIMADQQETQVRLTSRASTMYRSGDQGALSVLLGAATFEEFATRWDLLTRMNRQDASDLRALAESRARAEKSAKSLMRLQSEAANAAETQEKEVAKARKELSSSQAALRAYEAQVAKATKASSSSNSNSSSNASAPKSDSRQKLTGSGEWKTSLASHYGKNFHGRGASGKSIGPYSMMVAHEHLPFGTLIEFEYRGKRCVASVEDRGPYSKPREFDLGPGVIRVLGFNGVDKVRWRVIGRN